MHNQIPVFASSSQFDIDGIDHLQYREQNLDSLLFGSIEFAAFDVNTVGCDDRDSHGFI